MDRKINDACSFCHQFTFNSHLYVCEKCGKIVCSGCADVGPYDSVMIKASQCPHCSEDLRSKEKS